MHKQLEAGTLLIVGGNEDRTGPMEILQRFIDLAGGKDQPLAVLTAASEAPDDVWALYQAAFADLGATDVTHIRTMQRDQADQETTASKVARARGIFMTGGAQLRLMHILGDTATARAMYTAFEQGACVAGTSAGASALCADMLVKGDAPHEPETGAIELGKGLGFIDGVIVDQHFSQRHRINRLLTIIGEHPDMFGLGMDENTALVVQRGVGIEVAGEGGANVIDCRAAYTNINALPDGAKPVMLGVNLSVLPAGTAYELPAPGAPRSALTAHATPAPALITAFIKQLTTTTHGNTSA